MGAFSTDANQDHGRIREVDRCNRFSLFSRPLDQQAVTTFYSATGLPQSPVVTTFVPGHNLRLPRYDKWSAGLERDFGRGVFAGAEYLAEAREGWICLLAAGGRDGNRHGAATGAFVRIRRNL